MANLEQVHQKRNIFSDDIKSTIEIANPLFKKTGVEFFHYARIYDDGRAFNMLTDEQWLVYQYQKKYLLTAPIPNDLLNQEKIYYIIPESPPGHQVCAYDFHNLFNHGMAFDIIHRHNNFYEMFCFAANKYNHQMHNYYLNHINELENFVLYFRDKAANQLSCADKKAIYLPKEMRSNVQGLELQKPKSSALELPINRYYINDQVYLTKREFECLEKIAQGYVVKEAAKEMNISSKTMEYFIQCIKKKTKIYKKSDLIKLYYWIIAK